MAKIQVRKGVFETNSSSTHSLCLSKYPEEDIWEQIRDSLPSGREVSTKIVYDKVVCWPAFDDLYYINCSDDECESYFIMIETWVSKLVWLQNYIGCISREREKNSKGTWDIPNGVPKDDTIYKEFEKLAVEYLKGKGYEIESCIIGDESYWPSESVRYMDIELPIMKETTKNREWVKRIFDEVMNDEFTLIYANNAYHGNKFSIVRI